MEKKKFTRTPRDYKQTKPFKKYDRSDRQEKDFNEKPTNVRFYIFKCLQEIYFKKAYSNIAIDHIIRENKISELDSKLLTNIVYGTLSHDKLLRWEIKQLSEKAPKDDALIILLMSLYQLRFLDRIPQFAVLNEAVSLAKKIGGEAMGKYINAILRESLRQNLEFNKEKAKDEYEYLNITYNMPVWVIKMLETHYGKTRMLDILKYSQIEAPLTVRVNIHKANKEQLLTNPNFVVGNLAKNSLIYKGEQAIASTLEMKNGLISVQDESSQYVVEILDPKENEKVLDMCAAPGSKSQYISELMNNTGKILAIDIHPHRVQIMDNYLKELGLTNAICRCDDATTLSKNVKLVGRFDKILLDAPCMGIGVIRRKPDIALNLKSESLDEICALQSKLLEEAYKLLKSGGEMVYSTCSINKKENDSQIISFLSYHADMKRVYEKQIFTDEYNSDGFYICKMIKE